MHGRVKVKTTEQQEKEKKIEREAKLKAYRKAMSTLLSRRAEGLKDDMQLKISSQVLQSNPDISTLWNIRKEVILYMIDQGTQQSDESGDNKFDKDAALTKELDLTQQCLMTNPKSYGAWHHRTWSLEQMQQPDWSRELGLCQRYLKLDERNFHCWDYRKWVASKAGVAPQTELEFTMEKIEENFSNYSAWHYRSKLLPLVFPGSMEESIQEEIVHKELDLVQNAAFTDPEDSSAWFYHTWLLGRQAEPSGIIYTLLENGRLTVACTKSLESSGLSVIVNGSPENLHWVGEEERFNNLWSSKVTWSEGTSVKITLAENDEELVQFSVDGTRQLVQGPRWKSAKQRFVNLPSQKTKPVLEQALENCNQLLELEPDSKWTLYTKVLILLALDSHSNHKEILTSLENLKELDKSRANFYADLEYRLSIEHCIETADSSTLDLSGLKETNVKYHNQYLPAFVFVKRA